MAPLESITERSEAYLNQRAPVVVAVSGWPGSVTHASGTIGSSTMCVPTGMWATIQARASLRVSARDRMRPEWMLYTRPCPMSATVAIAMNVGRSSGRRREASVARRTPKYAASRHSIGKIGSSQRPK